MYRNITTAAAATTTTTTTTTTTCQYNNFVHVQEPDGSLIRLKHEVQVGNWTGKGTVNCV
jgi:hypothetical protein